MRTLLSIAHNRNFVKQKDRRTILSLFAEYKTKKYWRVSTQRHY